MALLALTLVVTNYGIASTNCLSLITALLALTLSLIMALLALTLVVTPGF